MRVTLSVRAHRDAHRLLTLVRGADKADVVRDAIFGSWNPARLPAQLLRRGCWVLDPEAATHISTDSASQG